MRVSLSTKDKQQKRVRKHLQVLARRGELTESAIEAIANGFDGKAAPHAKRYTKRLLALFRARVFSPYEIAGGKWLIIEQRAKSGWYTNDGQLLTRAIHESELQERAELRPLPKRIRPFCAATCLSGKPCQAKIWKNFAYCKKHLPKDDKNND